MLEHGRYLRANIRRNVCPGRAGAEGEGLQRARFEWRRKQAHTLDVCVEHSLHCALALPVQELTREEIYLVLLSGEVSDLATPVDARLSIVRRGGLKEVQPVVDEFFGVFTRRAKVDELNLYQTVKLNITRTYKTADVPGASARSTGSSSN